MIEQDVARWAANVRHEDVPADVLAAVERIFLDAVASGAAGLHVQPVHDVDPVARAFAGGEGPARTTFVAAYAITSATACDVYRPGLCHVTPVTVPPLLALADGVTREEFLTALLVGLELTPRLCLALNYPKLRARGWHSPGVAGTVGAAAATARLLGLDATGVRDAMAHGAAQAAGTFAALGTQAVKFNQARGALAALLAALMAREGLSASREWLTGADGGMAAAYTQNAQPTRLTDRLGEQWELQQISLRRWPAASSVQSLIDACLTIDAADGAERVEVELAPAAFQVSGRPAWSTPLEAQQSAAWVAASALVDGDWWLEHSTTRLGDDRIDALARRVHVTANDALEPAGVKVRVPLRSGRTIEASRAFAPGDPQAPLSHAQIEAKLRRSSEHAEELLAAVASGAYPTVTAALVRSEVPV